MTNLSNRFAAFFAACVLTLGTIQLLTVVPPAETGPGAVPVALSDFA